jgi:hypothetical protein
VFTATCLRAGNCFKNSCLLYGNEIFISGTPAKLNSFQFRARQLEGKTNVSVLTTLADTYFAEHSLYPVGDFLYQTGSCTPNVLGFRVTGCGDGKMRYQYNAIFDNSILLLRYL